MDSGSADANSPVVMGQAHSKPLHSIHLLCCSLVFAIAALRLFVVQGHVVKALIIAFMLLLVCGHFYRGQYLEKFKVVLPAFLLGIATPLLPGFSQGALLLLALCYCVFLIPRLPGEIISWASWPIYLLFVYVVVALIQGFDPENIKILYLGVDGPGDKGFSNIVQFLSVSPPEYIILIEAVSRYYVLFLLFSWFSYQISACDAFLKGLLACFPFAAISALLSSLGYLPTNFLPQSNYWTAQSRFSGTFSDPNAFGVFSAFILPLVVAVIKRNTGLKRILLGLLYVASLSMAMLSGSRSFILGILVFAFFVMLLNNKKTTMGFLLFGLALIALWNMWLWLAPESSAVFETSLPVALKRFFETISVDKIGQALFSRVLFYETALRMWSSSPVLGVGFNNFRDYVPLFTLLSGSDIGMWIDNANNWYLQILAEMGIIGAIAFVYAALQLKIQSIDRIALIFVPLFLILMFLGPHLEFDEITLISAGMFASVLKIRHHEILCAESQACVLGKFSRFNKIVLLILSACLVFAYTYVADFGFYGLEREQGRFFRWTSRIAGLKIGCNKEKVARLEMGILVPTGLINPMQVRIESERRRVFNEEFQPASSQTRILELQCSASASFRDFKIMVSNPWTPRKVGYGEDSRLLGIRVYGLPFGVERR